jgi:hypothetical protein
VVFKNLIYFLSSSGSFSAKGIPGGTPGNSPGKVPGAFTGTEGAKVVPGLAGLSKPGG